MELRNENKKKTIFLISGPPGVGKSTTSKILVRSVKQCVLIVGDDINHMFEAGSEPPWEERLRLTWKNILAITRNFIQHDFHVVIDFVVEDELQWFCEEISDLNVILKYVVLRADKEKIIERLSKRGDPHSLERSLFLLNKMEGSSINEQFIYDTTLKQPVEIVEEIINDSNFNVSY